MSEKAQDKIKTEQKTMEPNKVEIKYRSSLENEVGGIYSPTARTRLWGAGEPFTGKYSANKRRTFWNRQKEYTKTALIDLALYCDIVEDETLSEVINFESIELLLNAYFSKGGAIELNKPDLTKAEVARLLIIKGFNYLRYSQRPTLDEYDREKIDRALAFSDKLVDWVELRVRRLEDPR